LNPKRRKELERLALKRLGATDYDFLMGEGSELLFYQSWASLYDWFEGWGIPPDVELPWTDIRRSMIETGKARPTQRELLEWRDAVKRARKSDLGHTLAIHIVPVTEARPIEAFAVYSVHTDDPSGTPSLRGIYESVEEAMAALAKNGTFK
jgi:hypothetical protein